MKKDSLGDRMKKYEEASKSLSILIPRMPAIIRLDGRAFHSYTKNCIRPYDEDLHNAMNQTAMQLCKEISGAEIAYVQSDEISILLNNYKTRGFQPWFDGKVQKMVSVSAAIASAKFTEESKNIRSKKVCHCPDDGQGFHRDGCAKAIPNKIFPATFDSRIFVIPREEVTNYFIWRQQDNSRNSIQMLARSLYSHKELENKKTPDLQEMCFQKGKNWNDLPTHLKRGRCIVRNDEQRTTVLGQDGQETVAVNRLPMKVDNEIPIFTYGCEYIEKHLGVEKEIELEKEAASPTK